MFEYSFYCMYCKEYHINGKLYWEVYEMRDLTKAIQKIVDQTDGTWSIVLEDMDSNDKWGWNVDDLFYAASVIKVPIMVAVFLAAQEERLNLRDVVVLKKEDFVGGSGVLQHLTPGTSLTIYDIMTLMIIQSDNTATNILIDLVGSEMIQRVMKEVGMEKSTFFNKLMSDAPKPDGINQISALDIANLLKSMVTGQVVSASASEEMLEIMKKQQVRDCLPERLPSPYSNFNNGMTAWELANKTGWVPGIRHDVGVFYVGERKMIVVVLSKDADDLLSKQILSGIGEEIYNYLS